MATVIVTLEINRITGKFVSNDELFETLEEEIPTSIYVEDTEYEIEVMSIESVRKPRRKSTKKLQVGADSE